MKSPPGRRKFFFIVMSVVMAIGFVGLSIPTAQATDLGLVSAVNVTTIDNVDADSIAAVTARGSVFRSASMATTNITAAEYVIDIISDYRTVTTTWDSTLAALTANNKIINFNNDKVPQAIVVNNNPE